MTLPELSIKRHVLAWMMSAVLVLVGIIGYQRVGLDRYPFIEFPVISITTTLKGANPDIVDSSITNVIESAVNSVPGIEHVQSTSSPGVSTVNITFALEKKVDVAFNEVQSKVNQVLRRLPKDVDPPVVAKVETNAQPIMWLALQGDRTQQQLNQYAINVLKKRLETIDGVGEVRLGGRRDRTIRVDLLPDRMAAHKITAQDISDAFAKEHVQLAGGFVVGQTTESLVKLDLEFHQVDDLRGLIVAFREKSPVRLSDVAEIEDGLTDNRQLARFNGQTTVGLGMVKIANANTVAITERIQERVDKELRPALPPGMSLSVVSNDAVFIIEIVDSLKEHLIEGTLLAALLGLLLALPAAGRCGGLAEALARLRRMVGLWAFAYALLHLLAYAWLDRGLEWSELLADIAQRPFILVGTLAWGLLLLLALTSFDAAIRWLGGKRWRALHRAVYLVAPLALLHFYWMRAGKRNWLEVGVYALVLGLLLGWRAYSAWRARRRG